MSATGMSTCPIVFYDECRTAVVEAIEAEAETHVVQDSVLGTNFTGHVLDPVGCTNKDISPGNYSGLLLS